MLYKIINDTNQNITVLVSTGGESSGYLAGYDVPHNSSIMTENHAVDTEGDTNENKYIRIIHPDKNNNDVLSKKVPYSTQWHGGLRPYYTVTQENVTSDPNYVRSYALTDGENDGHSPSIVGVNLLTKLAITLLNKSFWIA